MKKTLWAKVLSTVLILAMITAWLPMGIASAEDGGTVPPDPPDMDSGGSDGDAFVPGEVLTLADSREHAQTIAEAYGLELKSYAYGIAVLSAPNPELTVAQSGLMRRAGIPKLGLNWIYHTNETAYKYEYKKDTYQRPAMAYNPYLEVADRTAVYRRATFDESDEPDEPITGQWHRAEMDIDRAWKLSTGTDVVIAVIDTGIDIDHPAFEGRISEKSYNAYANQTGLEAVRDDWGHGTHVSGIAAASLDSVADVSGVAPDAELLVIKANMPNTNEFLSEDLYRAINYAAANGADIINMSLGRYYADGENADALEQAVIAHAVAGGVTVVCSAGNDSDSHAGYPAAYPECIAVSATRQWYRFDGGYSNYGPEIDIAAPGSWIYSTANGGGYVTMEGTSMASPNVAGTAALILALNPDYSPQQVRDMLCGTARDAGALGRDEYYGSGIVNAYMAVCGPDALYNVSYNFGDGIRDSVVVKVIPGSTLLEPDIPLRDGYAFDGWFASGAEDEYDFATPVEGDLKLDAKWVEAEAGMYVLEFPDPKFRYEVLRMLNEQDGGHRKDSGFVADDLVSLASMESLFLWGMGIRDMTGLKYFSGLTGLVLSFNQLTELDISGNTALEELYCPGNQLTELNVSNNPALITLSCFGNSLTGLDVTQNTVLKVLYCYYNQLTELDVSQNTALEFLDCDGNELTELDVSKNTALVWLWCGYNQLTALDVSNNLGLKEFVCHYNQLTTLEVGNNTELGVLDCVGNGLSVLDLSNHMNLQLLYCGGNRLNTLKLPNPSALTGLYCESNQLSVLDISGMTDLTKLACRGNYLTELNVSDNAALYFLDCTYNYMASIDKVIDWQSIPGLILDETFLFYPQRSGNPPTGKDITDAFTDAGFLAAVRDIIGKPEGPILDYDVAWIRDLNVSAWNVPYSISDLSGIEHFGSLTDLDCSDQQLTALDVSNNTALTSLYCGYNQLTALDVSHNSTLKELNCYGNQLTALNISHNTGLWQLSCSDNQLTVLDVTQNTALEYLYCSGNQLTELDVSQNTELLALDCSYNQLPELDVSRNTGLSYLTCWRNMLSTVDVTQNIELWTLDCSYNHLTSLDVSKNTALENLYCYGNQLTELDMTPNTTLRLLNSSYNQLATLDITKNIGLRTLECSSNQLTALDVSKNTALQDLYCSGNLLTTLDVSPNTELWNLNCYGNYLTELDVSKNTALQDLYCYGNQLTALDVTKNTELLTLDCSGNQLATLDATRNTKLKGLDCTYNQLTELNVSKNTALQYLYCSGNLLTTLDVSPNTELWNLNCYGNYLTELDVSNNAQLEWLDCTYNYMAAIDKVIGWQSIPGLIPDETFIFYPQRSGNPPTGKDITDAFTDAGFLTAVRDIIGKPEGPILDYDVVWIQYLNVSSWNIPYVISDLSGIEHFSSLTYLNCSNQQLTALDVSKNSALENLYCYDNQLTALDVTQNTKLKGLDCSYNQLAELDVSQNTALESLSCENNQLTVLDVSQNTGLLFLYCWNNQLTELDVTPNTGLLQLHCSYNQLAALDVSQNTALESLSCENNQLTVLDVTPNTGLLQLHCSYNQLTELDVSNNTTLEDLYCYGNQLTALDVSQNSALEGLSCDNNQLTALDVFQNTKLKRLNCSYNQLAALDVSQNSALEDLYCSGNQLATLNISHNAGLWQLNCSYNQLVTLNVSQNSALGYLYCSGNQLATLNISHNTGLWQLDCSNNQLTALDISQNTELWTLDCAYNQLAVLDTTQDIALQYLYCFGNKLTALDVSNNTELKWLDCTYNYMKSIEDVAGWQTVSGLIPDDTFRFNPQWEAFITSIKVTTPTIMESLAANLRIITEGEHLEGKRLIAYLSVNGDLRCRTDITNGDLMRISAADAPAYGDECKVVVKVDDGNVQGDFTMNVAEYKPEELWTADVNMVDGKLLITFHADIALRNTRNCVTIGGKTYNAVVLTDKRTVEIQGFSGILAGGTTVIVSGVMFPELFPSYSLTFTLQG